MDRSPQAWPPSPRDIHFCFTRTRRPVSNCHPKESSFRGTILPFRHTIFLILALLKTCNVTPPRPKTSKPWLF